MTQELHELAGTIIALGYLVLAIVGPFLLFWFLYRVAVDLRRIADAAQWIASGTERERLAAENETKRIRRVVNETIVPSAFGR